MAETLDLFLVEDEDDVAFHMRRLLERAGHRVTVCRSGADALIVLTNRQFDLVLVDYRLDLDPQMNGLDLLHALHREGISTPVLMVTAQGSEEFAADVLRAGALDYVTKTHKGLAELPKRVDESVTRHRLLQSNRLLIAAQESARDGIFVTNLQGEVLHINGALERMFGFDRDELKRDGAAILRPMTVHHDDAPSPPARAKATDPAATDPAAQPFSEEMWRVLQRRTSWQGELVIRKKDGTLLDTSLTVSPIFDARGQMTHFVGIYRDITERKQMERQLFHAQKLQSVGTLAGGVAHEFNNLLAGIQGYAALGLREAGLSPTAREFLTNVVQLSDRAANLTRQLLAFARKPALSRQKTGIGRLVTGTADLVRRSLNLDVKLELDEPKTGSPLLAFADTNQLQQVLVNLCVNARDALAQQPQQPPAPIYIRVKHRLLATDLTVFPQNVPAGDYVVIEVEDHGAGMPPEVLSQALDPFFTTKEVGQGTGLGLPVAFGIMTGHQGFLTIDSRPCHGTCVRMYLPRLTDTYDVAATLETLPVLEPENSPSRNILVIDDEEAVTDVIRRFLAIAGHQVTCMSSGQRALEYLAAGPPVDLAILDLMIPREDGDTNYHRLRECRPELPILLCTGLVQGSEARVLQDEPTASLLRKPFRMSELWHAVNQCLQPREKK
jgi:signal transduction histidine kinase/CheY-like chemotaxis protein